MNTFLRYVFPGLMACVGLSGAAVATAGGTVEADVPIPMRDGVVLRGDVMRPAGAGPFPVLVYRTPYGKADALRDYTTFDRAVVRGYAVVIVDGLRFTARKMTATTRLNGRPARPGRTAG